MSQAAFTLLGTGAGPGLPSFFCECAGCREARNNPQLARTRSGAWLAAGDSSILIDASPDLRQQLIQECIAQVDGIFLTHWHYDHFGGLGELEYYVQLQRKEPIPLWLPPSAVTQFNEAFPHLTKVFAISSWEFRQPYRWGDIVITPLPANHGIETAGFLVESAKVRLAYFPDTAGLAPGTAEQAGKVDWLICDATFHGENWFPQAHMSITQAIELGRQIQADHTVLTHLAIHYSLPVTSQELAEEAAAFSRVYVGYDGMRIEL